MARGENEGERRRERRRGGKDKVAAACLIWSHPDEGGWQDRECAFMCVCVFLRQDKSIFF